MSVATLLSKLYPHMLCLPYFGIRKRACFGSVRHKLTTDNYREGSVDCGSFVDLRGSSPCNLKRRDIRFLPTGRDPPTIVQIVVLHRPRSTWQNDASRARTQRDALSHGVSPVLSLLSDGEVIGKYRCVVIRQPFTLNVGSRGQVG